MKVELKVNMNNLKVEFSFLPPDEADVGIHLFYGGDEEGEFHVVIFGFIIFSISIYRYLNIKNN